jgi:hypothetical protein
VRKARALLFSSSLKLGGVGIYGCEDRRKFSDLSQIYYFRARILRQSKLNEYIIIDSKVVDDHRSLAKNPMARALSGQWHFGQSKLDLK